MTFSLTGFGAHPAGFDTTQAFTGGYGNLLGGAKKKMPLDPTLLGLGAVSAGINLFGGLNQAQTSASIAQAQLAAQNAAIMEGREQAKGALASSMFGPIFAAGAGGDIAFGREKEAAMFETGPLAERKRAQEIDFRRALTGLEGSAEARELRQRENREALKRALAEREAGMAGMFGRIAPREVGTYFV